MRKQRKIKGQLEPNHEQYVKVRSEAQKFANETGLDQGIEFNPYMGYTTFSLPGKSYRQGHECRCEVVMCEILDKCQPGHGPMAKDERGTL